VLVQAKRNKRAALKLMRKLLKKYGFVPDKLVTDDLVCGHGSQVLYSSLGGTPLFEAGYFLPTPYPVGCTIPDHDPDIREREFQAAVPF
jgi:hypothetical protein